MADSCRAGLRVLELLNRVNLHLPVADCPDLGLKATLVVRSNCPPWHGGQHEPHSGGRPDFIRKGDARLQGRFKWR
jgi:hypothetical protein